MENEFDLEKFMTATEIARYLRISKSGLFALLKRGEFPEGIRIGRNRRWKLGEVTAWIESKGKENEE